MMIRLIALGAVMLSGAAAAEPLASNDDRTVTVKVSDLDMSTLDGRQLLHRRLRQAVEALCLEVTGTSPHYYAQSQCRKALWKQARAEGDKLTARAQMRAPQPTLADVALTTPVRK